MKLVLTLLALTILCASPLYADGPFVGCTTVVVNALGSGGADIVVDNTAGGVPVLAARTTLTNGRCNAVILNSSANDMRCGPTATMTVTSTVGFLVPTKTALVLGMEGQQAWNCIRTGSSNAAASVAEGRP